MHLLPIMTFNTELITLLWVVLVLVHKILALFILLPPPHPTPPHLFLNEDYKVLPRSSKALVHEDGFKKKRSDGKGGVYYGCTQPHLDKRDFASVCLFLQAKDAWKPVYWIICTHTLTTSHSCVRGEKKSNKLFHIHSYILLQLLFLVLCWSYNWFL